MSSTKYESLLLGLSVGPRVCLLLCQLLGTWNFLLTEFNSTNLKCKRRAELFPLGMV
jgi:hypothetical protein